MSTRPVDVVSRFLEAVAAGDFATLTALVADDIVWHGTAGFGTIRGRTALMQALGGVLAAFDGMAVTSTSFVSEGDRVAVCFTWEADHVRPLMGVPATGRRVAVTGICLYRVAGGQIVEEWWCEDMLGLLQQLGAVAAPEPAAA